MVPTPRRMKMAHAPPFGERVEDTKPRKLRLVGTVCATSSDDGRPVAAKLCTANGCGDYAIMLDDTGRQLAEQMAGQSAVVEGTMIPHDDQKALKVRRFRQARARGPSL